MRLTTAVSSVTALTVLTALAPAGTATAREAAIADWRAAACEDASRLDGPLGSYTVAKTATGGVRKLPSVTLTAERLVFTSGAQCDLVQLDGPVPFRRELRGHSAEITVLGQMVVGGADQGEMERATSFSLVGSSRAIRETGHRVLDAVVFRPDETGTMPDDAALPAPWRNQPYTSAHTRTTFATTISGRVGTERTFTVTPRTRAAAKRRLTIALALAQSDADRRVARKTYRLALRGIRLVWRRFTQSWSVELPR